MARHAPLRHRLGLLAAGLLTYSQAAAATPFSQQQYLIGDEGPYGYSTGAFRQATEKARVTRPYDVPGYDITLAAASGTKDSSLDGWQLVVKFVSDVPIPQGSPDSKGGSKVFDTALLSLSLPAKLAGALDGSLQLQDWSVCSAIWTMGLSEAALAGGSASGADASASSCGGLLSQECIAEMEAGFNSAGFCQNQTMPLSCAPFLANGTDGVTRGSNVPQTIGGLIADGPFFAATTSPLDTGDTTAFGAASTWVFPVVLSWTHRGASGSSLGGPGGDTRSHVACVRAAAAGSDKQPSGLSSGDGIGSGSARSSGFGWLLVGALAAGWAAVL